MSLIIKKNTTFKIPRTFIDDPNFNPSSDPYAANIVFNNTFNSNVNAQNTTWTLGPLQEITTAPAGCAKSNCLHLLQGVGDEESPPSVYSNQGFGQSGMVNLTESYTIECWFYVTNIDQNIGSFGVLGRFLLLRSDGGDPLSICFMGDRSIVIGIYNPDEEGYNESQTNISIFNLNSWNHFALVSNRSSGKTTTYVNGINSAEINYLTNTNGNGSNWGNVPNAAWEFSKTHGGDGNPYDIYISNMRWTQAVRYTSNFTPTFVNFYNSAN
jgi:hypothetical protein